MLVLILPSPMRSNEPRTPISLIRIATAVAAVVAVAAATTGPHTALLEPSPRPSAAPAPAPRHARWPEALEMLVALVRRETFSMGAGWFHPGESRYGWDWLSGRHDHDRDGAISAREMSDSPRRFVRLDRDCNDVLTADDLRWTSTDRLEPSDVGWTVEMIGRLFAGELGWWLEGPSVGDPAPDFALAPAGGGPRVQLSRLWRHRPVVLVFGSFT
jgi:hypothetical protein